MIAPINQSTINLRRLYIDNQEIAISSQAKMSPLPFLTFITVISASSFPLQRSLNPQPRASSADYRLPGHTYPVHYGLTLQPNLSNFSFVGEASIELEITEETSSITLHAYNLTVDVAKVSFSNESVGVAVTRIDYDEDYQFLIFQFGTNVSIGSYVLYIPYEGYLNSNNRGFYRGNYEDSEGNIR